MIIEIDFCIKFRRKNGIKPMEYRRCTDSSSWVVQPPSPPKHKPALAALAKKMEKKCNTGRNVTICGRSRLNELFCEDALCGSEEFC